MPLTVDKYEVSLGFIEVWMPKDAKLLSVTQHESPPFGGTGLIFVNALVDPAAELELRRFIAMPTGYDIGALGPGLELGPFVGTCDGGHVFEVLG